MAFSRLARGGGSWKVASPNSGTADNGVVARLGDGYRRDGERDMGELYKRSAVGGTGDEYRGPDVPEASGRYVGVGT